LFIGILTVKLIIFFIYYHYCPVNIYKQKEEKSRVEQKKPEDAKRNQKTYKKFDNYDTSIKIPRDSQKYYNENAIKNQIRLSKADRAKVRQISYEMGDICNITSKLPKYHRDYYIKKVIEIGVHSLGKVPLDTTLVQLIALGNHLKLMVAKNTDTTYTGR